MLDQIELRRMRWIISGFLILSLVLTVVGASTSVAVSDAAYTGAILCIVGISAWVIRWAKSSNLVRWLTLGALVLIAFAQTLDITEDFELLAQVPLLGSDSYWNGHVASVSFLAGLVTTFAVLMFALVEARLGRLAHEKYHFLADHVSDVISALDENLSCTYISPSVRKFSGFSVEEVLTGRVEDFLVPESLARFRERVNSERILQSTGVNHDGDPVTLELEYKRADGGTVWAETRFAFLREPSDVAGNLIAVIRDISERKQAEEERSRLEGQLFQSQKMESVGCLAGGVAHDFNNMLMVILGHADLLRGKCNSDERLREHADEIRVAALRSADLTRQLLAFARQQVVAPREIDLNRATASMLKLLGRLIGERIHLDWRPGSQVWPVCMDPSQVDQILANICVNARDAISGSGEITIQTENVFRPEGGEFVRLTIRDNGCGMDEETRQRIFEPFFTTKQAGRGTGLGLSTVYGIVTQSKGHIQVFSAPGEGTTFKIDLPRMRGDNPPPLPEPTTGLAHPHGKETIMVVEDEASMLLVVQTMLQHLGYCVLPTSTSKEALELAHTYPGAIDLLLSDIVLREADGRVLAVEILKVRKGLKCLFMSGYMSELEVGEGIMLESRNFIEKPFVLQGLADKVRQVLDREVSISVTV